MALERRRIAALVLVLSMRWFTLVSTENSTGTMRQLARRMSIDMTELILFTIHRLLYIDIYTDGFYSYVCIIMHLFGEMETLIVC